MAIYEYECPNGHRVERLRREADRNEPFVCEECFDSLTLSLLMRRTRIELQKRARVVGGTIIHHRNEQRYTRGLN